MDIMVVNVGVPAIRDGLQTGTAAVQLLVAGYVMTYAALLILGGRLGDLYGHRTIFVAGMAIFSLTSLVAGAASSAVVVVLFRMLQGVGAALVLPQVLSGIQLLFEGKERARALSLYGGTMAFASVVGQLLGGVVLDVDLLGLGWRAVFLVKLPLCAAVIVAVLVLVPNTRTARGQRLDVRGAAVAVLGLALFVVPLVIGREVGWPAWALALLVLSAPVLWGFAVLQHRAARAGRPALLDPALFRQRSFTVGTVAVAVFFMSQLGFYFVLAVVLQRGLGFSALEAGVAYAPLGLTIVAASFVAGALSGRFGHRLVELGALLMIAGSVWFAVLSSLSSSVGLAATAPPLMVFGAGVGLSIVPLYHAVLSGVPARDAGAASGVVNTAQQLGNTLGATVIGVALFTAMGDRSDAAAHVDAFPFAVAAMVAALLVVIAMLRALGAPSRQAG
jgi:EmrB/QacA subfamily drug resistance transporter